MAARDRLVDASCFLFIQLAKSMSSERGRFGWVTVFWSFAFFFFGAVWAIIVGLLALLIYWKHFVIFIKKALQNEWPYNILSALGALLLYIVNSLTSVICARLISTITGFHVVQFPGAEAIMVLVLDFFALSTIFVIISGLAAVVTGFSSDTTKRIFPVAFMLSAPSIYLLAGSSNQIYGLTEDMIIASSFHMNSTFDSGDYTTDQGVRRAFGTKTCQTLPFDELLTPHTDGGYITAVRRPTPAAWQMPAPSEHNKSVSATKYVYGFIEQKECPHINEYIEYREGRAMDHPNWIDEGRH